MSSMQACTFIFHSEPLFNFYDQNLTRKNHSMQRTVTVDDSLLQTKQKRKKTTCL